MGQHNLAQAEQGDNGQQQQAAAAQPFQAHYRKDAQRAAQETKGGQQAQAGRPHAQHFYGQQRQHYLMGKAQDFGPGGGNYQAEHYPVVFQGAEVVEQVFQQRLPHPGRGRAGLPQPAHHYQAGQIGQAHHQKGRGRPLPGNQSAGD